MGKEALALLAACASPVFATDRSRCAVGVWDAAPLNVPLTGSLGHIGGTVDGPVSGNGDVGLVVGEAAGGRVLMYVDSMQVHDPVGDTGQSYCGYDSDGSGKRGVGLVTVQPANGTTANNSFAATQAMANATVGTTQQFDGGAWSLHTQSYVAATANVVVTRLWWTGGVASGAATRSFSVETAPLTNGAPQCIRQDVGQGGPAGAGVQWFNRTIGRTFRATFGHPRSVRKTHLMRVAAGTAFAGIDPSQRAVATDGSSSCTLTLREGQRTVLVTALFTNRDFLFERDGDMNEPLRSVGAALSSLVSGGGAGTTALAQLEADHAAWWGRHWAKSGVQFQLDPDGTLSVVERMWYGTVYMLTVTNRVNYTIHTPPSGLWHNFYTADTLPWSGFTTDINTQSPYFGAAAANHAETELAMIDLHDQFIPMGRLISSAAYNCSVNGADGGGVLLPVEIAAYGGTKIWDDQGLKSNAILMAMVHVAHGRLTGDIGGQVYRFLREVALFWQCYLVNTPLTGGGHAWEDRNDCCYEICSANNYDAETAGGYIVANNPTNSLAMIRTLFEAMVDFSTVLGVDAELRPLWRDILANLAPYPTTRVALGNGTANATIFVDWEGAPPPPKNDRQMLGCIQVVYPAGRVSSSSPNRTLFTTARNLLDYLDQWRVSSDADCIIFQISTRLNYNQTTMYPNFARALGSQPRPGFTPLGNLLQNGLTVAQNAGGALQYVNELLVRSDEPFVRFFPAHFSSVDPELHGRPLPAWLRQRSAGGASRRHAGGGAARQACNFSGDWYDLSSNGTPHPKPFRLRPTGPSTFAIDEPNEWGCPVNVTRSEVEGHPAVPPTPRLPGQPDCGIKPGSGAPATPPHTQLQFVWPAHGQTKLTVQSLSSTPDCQHLCFQPAFAAQGQGPYGRVNTPPPPGTCGGGGGGGAAETAARPWLNSSFSNLRVKGAQGTDACPLDRGLCTFLVSASLSSDGVVSGLAVLSERGGNFTFLAPFGAGVAPSVRCVSGPECPASVPVPARLWAPAGLFHLEPHEAVWAFPTSPNCSYSISSRG